jgi:hypothetical protein
VRTICWSTQEPSTVQLALKGVQLEPSAPELEERQAGLRESQSLNLVHWRQMFQAGSRLEALANFRLKWAGKFPGSWDSRKEGAARESIPSGASS